MALHWRPVGPEPSQTYWVRRAVVAGAALLVLWLLAWLLFGGDEPDERLAQAPAPPVAPTPFTTAEPSATPSTSPDPSASPGPDVSGSPTPSPSAAACPDEVLDVSAAAEQQAYPVGATPRLALSVTNTGPTSCARDMGQSAVELVVVSGPDRIWSSDDCAPGGDADLTTLEPGAVEVSRVTWPGTRSRPGCTGSQDQARAGTYRVEGRVGDLRVDGESFLLR